VTPEHLYIHVPFCVRRCVYCDFAVTATSSAPVDAWLDAVVAELAQWREAHDWSAPLPLRTLYIGGGTPSMLGTGAMSRLRDALAAFASWNDGIEWTAEANPETFPLELARDWMRAGVNRVSLGAQTFHEPALRWMGRLHGAEGPARAVAAAREAGFDNLSIDLIFGLPDSLGRDWARDLGHALELAPEHVSLYGLTAEAGTPLGRRVAEGTQRLADEDGYAAQYRLAAETLRGAGYEHYEVSNFAQPGRESRHNQAYWRHRPYLGIGPGAHSFMPPVRSWNVRDWAEYRARLLSGRSAREGEETLGGSELSLESTWLGLRSTGGLPVAALTSAQQALVTSWESAGLAQRAGDQVQLTTEGWLLLDRLAVELDGRSS
jgi:oxygen-independent coproporphyrinogen III oxidase